MELERTSTTKKAKEPVVLPSWNPGSAKRAIIDFVTRVSRKESIDYVPIAERIAVFDNDGTLWGEKPVYMQIEFLLARIKALAPDHPEWKDREPFKSALQGDLKAALSGGEISVGKLLAATHAGMTTDEFTQSAWNWFMTSVHPQLLRPYVELLYQPMLELMTYLRANDFKIYIASADGVDFMRAITQKIYDIPPEQVIGSSGKTRYVFENGHSFLVKTAELDVFDEGAGKPSSIYKYIGRRPIAAFGNSDGDFEMLQWISGQDVPHLSMLIHHTDESREWAYDHESRVGHLDRALDAAPANQWTVVDMKKDWNRIYPFNQ